MKNLPYIVALVWFLQVVSCRGQEHSLQMKRVFLTSVQMDSLRKLNGKEVPKSLWEIVIGDSWPPPQPIHFLSGNLDEDAAQEIVLWYKMETIGQAICLDHRGDVWEKVGAADLNFFHGNKLPRINSKARMLLCYTYGWGSSYGSEVLHFYESQNDSLVCVFSLLEREGLLMQGSYALRVLSARYKFVDASQITVTYHYKVTDSDDNHGKARVVFEKTLVIPFYRDKSKNCFLPKLPNGFPPIPDSGFIYDGESTFDQFFEPELQKIISNGPLWKKRVLLGNLDAH